MKNIILMLLIGGILFSACTSAYKATSTPDDVYYSPAPVANAGGHDEYVSNNEDNYLRMKVKNRYQWDGIDDYTYWNDSRYDFGYSCTPSRSVLLYPNYGYGLGFGFSTFGLNSWYSPYYGYNPYYSFSPYNTIVYYKTPQAYLGNTGKTNLTSYRNYNYNNRNANADKRNSLGSLLTRALSNDNNASYNQNNNNNVPTRTFNNNTVPSSNAGGRSGGYNSSGSSSGSSRAPR